MSNAVAVIPIRYRRSDQMTFTDLQTDPIGLYLAIARGLNEPAEVRGEDDLLVGTSGRFRRNRKSDRRRIVLVGLLEGTGTTWDDQLADYRNRMQALRALLDPTDYGVLQADLEDGDTVEINAWPLPDWGVTEVGPTLAQLTIGLESVDPDWVSSGS